MTEETGTTGQADAGWSPRAVALGGAALLAACVGLSIWALGGPEPPPEPVFSAAPKAAKKAPIAAPETKAIAAPETKASPPAPAPMSSYPSGQLDTPREVSQLLAQRFQFTRKDGTPAFTQLRGALGPERAVTVLNVWAPYCEPCKREFPSFRRLQAGWGDDVRFMPIQLGEGERGPLAAVMPDATHHLIDFVPGGAVQQTLAALGLLPDRAPIPITLVLDCRHQLRWLQAEEVTDMAAFERAIGELRRELDTPACTRPSAAAAPPGSPAVKRCGDGVCEPLERSEDCLTCPQDCGCKDDQLCATQTGSNRSGLGHVCMDELQ